MSEDEIIKALTICSGYTCTGYPMKRRVGCRSKLLREALKLIGKKKEEQK